MNRLPPLLITCSLLFWGLMAKRMEVAVPCALLLQAAQWSRLRWDFGERSALVAWRLSVLFLTLAMILETMQPQPRITTMARVFTWLPILLLPLQFVQTYGTSDTMSLGTFSMMIRRRRQHAEKHGLPFREIRFSFDNVFLCATLLAASLKGSAAWFFPCMVALIGWAIVARFGRGWAALSGATVIALLVSALVGIGGQMGLAALYGRAMRGGGSGGSDDSASERRTSIGERGRLKQSPEIKWRLYPEKGQLPRLLRLASYNRYSGTTWEAILPEGVGTMSADFEDDRNDIAYEPNPLNPDDKFTGFYVCPANISDSKQAISADLPRFRLRGSLGDDEGFTMLPFPAEVGSTTEFVFESLQRNSFGTFRVQPTQPVCDARILWGDSFESAKAPWNSAKDLSRSPKWMKNREQEPFQPDLEIPAIEMPALERVADDLDLHEGTTEEKIDKLREFFGKHFTYTKYNQMPDKVSEWTEEDNSVRDYVTQFKVGRERPTLIGIFLEHARTGHCEFFATATALLLREAGVPTRYACGFAVVEAGDKKTGEMVVRGTHAHAWCRVWDEEKQRWLDIDLTPPDWTGKETPRKGAFQDFQDWFKTLREDLLVWRDKPGHMTLLTVCLLAPVGIGMIFILRRLWRSRQRLEAARHGGGGALVVTPLAALDKTARRILGSRPAGTPLGIWLAPLAARLTNPALLGEALSLHHRLRFDPQEGDKDLVGKLQELVAEIRRQIVTASR